MKSCSQERDFCRKINLKIVMPMDFVSLNFYYKFLYDSCAVYEASFASVNFAANFGGRIFCVFNFKENSVR